MARVYGSDREKCSVWVYLNSAEYNPKAIGNLAENFNCLRARSSKKVIFEGGDRNFGYYREYFFGDVQEGMDFTQRIKGLGLRASLGYPDES